MFILNTINLNICFGKTLFFNKMYIMKRYKKINPIINVIFEIVALLIVFASCSTKDIVPENVNIETGDADSITDTTAICACTIKESGEITFTGKGICWDTLEYPTYSNFKTTDGSSKENFTSKLIGLKPATVYYARSYVLSGEKIWYGQLITFTTKEKVGTLKEPELNLKTQILHNSFVVMVANISVDSTIEIKERGVCWSTSQNPTIKENVKTEGSGSGKYEFVVNGLSAGTMYYVRAYAKNANGVYYSNTVQLKTLKEPVYGTVSDVDGNKYKTVVIGDQTWMAENLRTTSFSDGSPIQLKEDSSGWRTAKTSLYCSFNNRTDATFIETFGLLYNKYAVIDSKNVCPSGWHVPTTTEWDALRNYLIENNYGMYGSSSTDMIAKALSSTSDWTESYTDGYNGYKPQFNNSSGFDAKPAGYRYNNGTYHYLNNGGCWWSSTSADYVYLNYIINTMEKSTEAYGLGFSVRCVKNN